MATRKHRKAERPRKRVIRVEDSEAVSTRPRQLSVKSEAPRGKPLGSLGRGNNKHKHTDTAIRRLSAKNIEAAAAQGMLPHEFMLAVMRGDQIKHFAYDQDTQEVVEIIVLPTFGDRIEAAKTAAPYYAARLTKATIQSNQGRDYDGLSDAELDQAIGEKIDEVSEGET